MPSPSAACVRDWSAKCLERVSSDMSTLMSSRVKPRFKMASTADSAATLLLKSPVTNFAFSLSAIQSSPTQSSLCDRESQQLCPLCQRSRPCNCLINSKHDETPLFGFRTVRIENPPD